MTNDEAKPGRGRGGRRRRIQVTLAALLACVAAGAWTFRLPLWGENFAIVEPGRVYRSAQPRENLARWVREHEIASILNLRGGSRFDAFYRDELRVAREAGVSLYNVPMSATARPPRAEILRIVEVLDTCRYPLLIHCKQGADRTGLATTLYRMLHLGEPPRVAMQAFAIEHSHIPLFGTQRLHEPFDEYSAWLGQRGLSHTPARFRAWLRDCYRDPAGAAESSGS